MATSPDSFKDTLDVSALKVDIPHAFRNCLSGHKQKPRMKPKRGSTKYLHLQKFIETRRQKKRAKRRTLDPSAKETFPIELVLMMMMMTMTMHTSDIISFLLLQPVDVSHIYVPDLHERQQRRMTKKNNMKKVSEVS